MIWQESVTLISRIVEEHLGQAIDLDSVFVIPTCVVNGRIEGFWLSA